jgi:lipopolysaccharide/colanic/teichoic acid biosynthesis glycosyltransferase
MKTTIFRKAIRDEGAPTAGRMRAEGNGRRTEAVNVSGVRNEGIRTPDATLRVIRTSTIWGLSVQELHDAYWRTCGVQCLRPNTRVPPARKADLYMLLAPQQLVLFDLSHIVNRLVWHGAALTYVHVLDLFAPTYREQAIVDDQGFVQRIARHYADGTASRTRHRLLLTDRPRIALRWINAENVREARRAVRRPLSLASIDHVHTTGCCFDESTARDRALRELIERWSDPDRVIEGIEELAPGVWGLSEPPPEAERPPVLVGPAWLGKDWMDGGKDAVTGTKGGGGASLNSDTRSVCAANSAPRHTSAPTWLSASSFIVGPAWRFDAGDGGGSFPAARIRSFDEIEQRHTIRGASLRPRRRAYAFVKRAFDITVSLSALAMLAPLQLLIALAILLDDGRPLLFRHRRQSRGGKPFDCLKFRTMRPNAEAMVQDLKASNLCDGPQVFIKDDPRCTRVGRILRSLHLDELPQLWNVLRGDMSIVGPRPSPDNENQFCPAWRELRLSVRPGITGLWQLKRTRSPGRDFQEWIRYDIEYVRRASFRLDLSICLRTALVLLFGSSRRCE